MNELTNKTTNTQILDWYKNAPDTDCIYGYMYGQPTILVYTLTGLVERPDEIVSIKNVLFILAKMRIVLSIYGVCLVQMQIFMNLKITVSLGHSQKMNCALLRTQQND